MHETLCDYVLELVNNAIEAGAKKVDLLLEEHPDNTLLRVLDDGKGMCAEEVRNCFDPFRTDSCKHPERRTGLGLALLEAAVFDVEGTVNIKSEPGLRTEIMVTFDPRRPDALPVGNLAELGLLLCSGTETCSFRLTHHRRQIGYQIDFQTSLSSRQNSPLHVKTEIARWEETLVI